MTLTTPNPNWQGVKVSDVRKGTTTITAQQAMLGDCLNKAHIEYMFDFEVEREPGRYPYRIDILAFDRPRSRAVFGLEAFGDGTKCDDITRHAFITGKGIPLVYFPNKLIEMFPGHCVREVRDYFSINRRYF